MSWKTAPNVRDKLSRCVEKVGQDKEKLLIVLNGAARMKEKKIVG